MKENKFVKIITNNFGLKILAVVIAFSLWLVVVNYDDPVISNTYSGIPVDIINVDALAASGKVYSVLNNTDVISVTITGKRTVVESIGKDNIKAVADLSNINSMNRVQITVSTNKNFEQLESIKSDIPTLELNIENLKELNLPIQVETTGEPASGYMVGDVVTGQNTIKVSGAESLVSRVASAKLIVDVSGRTSDMSTSADVLLFDSDGNEIDKSLLNLNVKSINVSVSILQVKAVNIIYSYSGIPADGYAIFGSIVGDRQAVYVAGKSSAVELMSSITIPPTAISVEGKDESFTTVVDLGKYLPDGIRLADADFDGKVAVTIDIEPTVTRVLNIPMNNISVTNVPEGYSASIYISSDAVSDDENVNDEPETDVKIKVTTEGVMESYDSVIADDIIGYVDVDAYLNSIGKSSIEEGIYQMEIDLELPEGVKQCDICYASVEIQVQ